MKARAIASISAAVLALPWVAASCSNLPAVEPPPPIVQKAPADVAHLAIHVFQHITPAETPEDNWDYHHMPGYTANLRRQFQGQLQQAGFTVILDRKTPADIVATIQSDMPYETTGVATLVLSRRGQVLDRISVPVRVEGTPPKTVHLVGEAAVRLVEALERSPAVAAVARELATGAPPALTAAPPAGASTLTMATDCPPERNQPPEPAPPRVDCIIERTIRCQGPSPVRSAWQPEPFVECPTEIPFSGLDSLNQRTAKFSAQETRSRRLGGACGETPRTGDCCYLELSGKICR